MQFPRCNSHILHEQLQQSERLTDTNVLFLSQCNSKTCTLLETAEQLGK